MGVTRKAQHDKFSVIRTYHIYVCVSGGKKCSVFRKFDVLCFLVTPVLRFTLLLYDKHVLCM